MRLRGRAAFKLLTVLVAGAIILIVTLSYFTSNGSHDEFLSMLSAPLVANSEQRRLAIEKQDLALNKLINLTNFQYTLANDLCQNYNVELLGILIVTSYVGHDELRAAHRKAIPQSKLAELGFQRVFLLAEIPPQERFIEQRQLQDEQKHFGDLLQGNFQEAYRNLTYKHTMGLRWAATNCKRAHFIVKVDDDIVYDVFQLRHYLESLEVEETELASSAKLLAGFVLDSKPPIRNSANKWFVSEREFSPSHYPPYLSGWLYITNPATALRLVREAQRTDFFWIDDIWVTGMLRLRLDIPMQRLNSWYSANAEFMDCCVRDLKQSNYECEYYVGPNGGDSKMIVEFLHNVEKCYFDECVKRTAEKALKRTCVANAKRILPEHGDAMVREVKLRR